MLRKAGNKRLEAEVYIGADIQCYYFPRIFFRITTYFFYPLPFILICGLVVMLYEKHLTSSLYLAVAFLSLKASGIK